MSACLLVCSIKKCLRINLITKKKTLFLIIRFILKRLFSSIYKSPKMQYDMDLLVELLHRNVMTINARNFP